MRAILIAAAMTLSLVPVAAAAADRDISLAAGKGQIHGSLRTPEGFKHGPAVLIIAGSGPTDRNGDSTVPGVTPGAYRLLADALEKAGIPSLRYDKRGIGASASVLVGDQPMNAANAGAAEAGLKITTFSDDAALLATRLAAEPGVSCVVILGHSEGSLLGLLAAQKVPVCGYISVAGAGRPIEQVLLEQLNGKLPPDLAVKVQATIDALKAGKTVADPPIPALFRPSMQPYLISWFPLDPAVEIGKVKAPVLILQGDNDLQVSVADAERLAKARPDGKLVIVKGMNHVLKIAPTDPAANIAAYADPALPLAPELVSAIVGFVNAAGARH